MSGGWASLFDGGPSLVTNSGAATSVPGFGVLLANRDRGGRRAQGRKISMQCPAKRLPLVDHILGGPLPTSRPAIP